MKKPSLLPVFLLSSALLLIGAACSKSTITNTVSDTTENTTIDETNTDLNATLDVNTDDTNAALDENTNSATNTAVTTKSVSMDNFAFSPSSVTVKKGAMVTWTNNDSTSHTVTSTTGSELSSGTLGNGQSYNHTFTTAGTYAYQCNFHPSMTGTVVVTE